jgi:hypothetical protein
MNRSQSFRLACAVAIATSGCTDESRIRCGNNTHVESTFCVPDYAPGEDSSAGDDDVGGVDAAPESFIDSADDAVPADTRLDDADADSPDSAPADTADVADTPLDSGSDDSVSPDVGDTYTPADTIVDVTTIPVDAAPEVAVGSADVAVDARDDGAGPMACDSMTTPSTEGTVTIAAALDFDALCGGVALVGDRIANRIVRIALSTGAIVASYGLTASPHSLALDSSRQLLYVSLSPATKLARINLVTGSVTYIHLSLAAQRLALASDGHVLALTAEYPVRVVWVDGVGGWELGVKGVAAASTRAAFIAFVPSTNTMFLGDTGSSSSEFGRYAFDSSSPVLALLQKSSACQNGQHLAVSPVGTRLAFACGGGNGGGYGVYDFAAGDLASSSGEWATGAYPRAAAFSPDGASFGSTNGTVLQLFGTTSHTLLKTSTAAPCGSSLANTRFSRDGKLLVGLAACSSSSPSHHLVWMPVP